MFADAGAAPSTTVAAAQVPFESMIGDWYRWVVTDGLSILLWVLGAAIVIRFIRWLAERYETRIEADFADSDMLVRTERSKHMRAVIQVVAWTSIVIVALVCGLKILGVLNVPVTSLVGPSAVIGAALGFGAQRVVQDILAGFFVVTEKQYGYGDVVDLAVTGGSNKQGTVEDVTLRVTRLRTSDGEVVTVPNGQIITATNLSKDWARAVVDVPIPSEADIACVTEILDQVGERFFEEERWHKFLLDAPAPLGITDLELESLTIRMVARTLPGQQFAVSRALRSRIEQALAAEGISVREVPTHTDPAPVGGSDEGGAR